MSLRTERRHLGISRVGIEPEFRADPRTAPVLEKGMDTYAMLGDQS
jgi:hypothetical protein